MTSPSSRVPASACRLLSRALLRWRFSGRSGHPIADRLPSEAAGKFVEREPNPVGCGQVGGDCVVGAAQVLHERVSGRDYACG